jgi:hypothetical protein
VTINLSYYEAEIEELEPGETTRVDHKECSAGVDTRSRLYLTRVLAQPQAVIAYCHNCQQSGRWYSGKYLKYREDRHKTPTYVPIEEEEIKYPPKHHVNSVIHWPSSARAWTIKNKLNQDICDRYHITYDVSADRVWLPRYRTIRKAETTRNYDLMGYQLRLTEGTGPKYTTVLDDGDVGFTQILCAETYEPMQEAIIVEDLVSGIHVAEACGSKPVMVIVNYGVKVNPQVIAAVSDVPRVYVWLDNDNPHVKRQAKTYERTIAMYGKEDQVVSVIEECSDPKHYDRSLIVDRLKRTYE